MFRVGVTRDFLTPAGELAMGDIGLRALKDSPYVSYEFFHEHLPEVAPEQIADYDGVISLSPRFTKRSLSGDTSRLGVLARFGVGYDMVDVDALTERDILLTITPDGVRRPVASAIVTLILALTHELFAKDRLVRQGRWVERQGITARGLTGKVLGSIGVGNIGRELFRLIKPFEMAHLGFDPLVKQVDVEDLGVKLVDLETLMRRSDFVSINCPLKAETKGIVGERELSWMKPEAYLINTARGALVDQEALYRALKEKRIRGAGLDVFDPEPLPGGDPLAELENVILTPHSICWTDECFRTNGECAVRSVLDALQGRTPEHVVNREVLSHPGLHAKLEENRRRWTLTGGESN